MLITYGIFLPVGNNSYDGRTIVGRLNYYPFGEFISFCIDFAVATGLFFFVRKIGNYKIGLLTIYPLIFFICCGVYSSSTFSDENLTRLKSNIKYSRDENTIVFVFDGMSNRVLNKILDETPSYSSTFTGFTNFTNAITKHPGTWASLGEILGGSSYSIESVQREGKKPKKMALVAAPLNSVKEFKNNNFSAEYFLFENAFGGERNNVVLNYLLISMVSAIPYSIRSFFYSNGNWLGVPNVILDFSSHLPDVIGSTIVNPLKISPSYFDDIANIFSRQYIDRGLEKSINIFYFSIPHPPLIVNSSCNEIPEEKTFAAYEDQSKCALKFSSSVINFLKENNLFNKSRILIVSDHGWPANWTSSAGVDAVSDIKLVPNGGFQGRITSDMVGSVLMYKGADVRGNAIKDDSLPIYVQDAFKLLCNDGLQCPSGLKGNFQQPNMVYTTSSSDGTWDEGPFVLTGTYQIIGPYRDPRSWTVLNEK